MLIECEGCGDMFENNDLECHCICCDAETCDAHRCESCLEDVI